MRSAWKKKKLRERTVQVVDSLIELGSKWREIDFGPRRRAEDRTLESDNRFTEQALAFAINQQMSLLTRVALTDWAKELEADSDRTVGVLNPGNIPLGGFQDFIAVLLSGHRYLGTTSSKSPALLPAIADFLCEANETLEVAFVDFNKLVSRSDAIIASGSDESMAGVRESAEGHEIETDHLLLRGHRYSVCIMDGQEGQEECVALAEDVLLHEGQGCRNVATVWAPEHTVPDALLDAMARFRAMFPAHPDTAGSLEMQRALLEAVETPIAYGEGLEFLMSKGEPEPQAPGHVRWSEYRSLEDVEAWIEDHKNELQLVVVPDRLVLRTPSTLERSPPGDAQRPNLGWRQDGIDVAGFLRNL